MIQHISEISTYNQYRLIKNLKELLESKASRQSSTELYLVTLIVGIKLKADSTNNSDRVSFPGQLGFDTHISEKFVLYALQQNRKKL